MLTSEEKRHLKSVLRLADRELLAPLGQLGVRKKQPCLRILAGLTTPSKAA